MGIYETNTLQDQAKEALERSRNVYKVFQATLTGVEGGSLKIEALKEAVGLVQSVDRGWLDLESRARMEKIEKMQVIKEPELPGADQERQIALRILKEKSKIFIQ